MSVDDHGRELVEARDQVRGVLNNMRRRRLSIEEHSEAILDLEAVARALGRAPVTPREDEAQERRRPVLVARCTNYREDLDEPCTGELRYRWGQGDAACGTCGARCGVMVAEWSRVESPASKAHACPCGTVPESCPGPEDRPLCMRGDDSVDPVTVAEPCGTCGHARVNHHKLRCEHPRCDYCNGWTPRAETAGGESDA